LEKHVYKRGGGFIGEDGRFRYGKYKGEHVHDVEDDYLSWVYETTNFESDRRWIDG
jgi:hypothetical protein